MQDQNNTTAPAAVRRGILIAGALTAVIGVVCLVAWLSGTAARWSATGVITVKTNTALAMLLAGPALLLLSSGKARGPRQWLGAVLAGIVLLIGALSLSEHVVGWNLGIDQLLAGEAPGAVSTLSPNRMGPPAATCFTLIGAALLSLAFRRRAAAPFLGLAVCLINLVPAIGFMYSIHSFYERPHLTFIAWPTVVALLSLGMGLVLTRADRGPIAMLFRDDAGGALLRRLLPPAVLVPLVLGFLRVQGQHRGLYDTATGTGLLVLVLILVFSVMLWRAAGGLSRSAEAQQAGETALQNAYEELDLRAEELASINEELMLSNEEIAAANEEMRVSNVALADEIEQRKLAEEGLRESEEALYSVALLPSENPNPIMRLGADGELLYSNVPADALLLSWGGGSESRVPRELAQSAADALNARAVREIELSCGDRVFSFVLAPIPDQGYVNLYGRDMTDRRHAEEALTETRDYLDSLINYANAPIIVWDADSRITRFNRAFERLTGHTADEMVGKDLQVLFPEATRCESLSEIERTLAGEHWDSVEIPILRKDGEVRVALWNSASIRAGNTLLATIAQGQDITERKKAEEALAQARVDAEQRAAELRTVLDAVPAAVWIAHDPECKEITGNAAADEIVMQVPRGANISASARPGDAAVSYRVFRDGVELKPEELPAQMAATTGKSVPDEAIDLVFADGRTVHMLMGAVPLFDAEARVRGSVAAGSDITTVKQAEEALRELEAHKRDFYRGTIMAATGGKLEIVEPEDIRALGGELAQAWKFATLDGYSSALHQSFGLAESLGLVDDSLHRFMSCAGEMLANAQKHAGGGEAALCKTDGRILFVVSDTGPGIDSLNLPDVAFVRGYSTAGTGGLGYKLIIACADKTYLATGPDGTTVAVEIGIPS